MKEKNILINEELGGDPRSFTLFDLKKSSICSIMDVLYTLGGIIVCQKTKNLN